MKITELRSYVVSAVWKEWVFVIIDTDEGIQGVGEATLEYRAAAVVGALQDSAEYLIGRDPRHVERIWGDLYEGHFWRGGPAQMTALSAIDQCLWDIVGKAAGLPVHQFFGGPVRQEVPVYLNQWFRGASSVEQLASKSLEAVEKGYTALKWYPFRFSPLTRLVYGPPNKQVRSAIAQVEAVRSAVGPDVRLMVDLSAVPDPATAAQFCRQVVDYDLFFVEEPVPPDNAATLAHFSRSVPVPIASGERLFSRWDFRELIESEAVAFIQPDVSHCGGLSESRRVAAMAETHYIGVVAHNPNGPVSTAASVQFAAATPNFVLLEIYPNDVPPIRREIVQSAPEIEGSAVPVPTAPGLGVEVDEDALRRLAVPPTGHSGRRPTELWKL